MRRLCLIVVMVVAVSLGVAPRAATPRFFADDPIASEPETEDASSARPRDIDLVWDLAVNALTRPGDSGNGIRAGNVNTIDEVPDSGWFTNRILSRPLTPDGIARGPITGPGPSAGPWTVTHPKTTGFAPGFRMRDRAGDVWFVSLDPVGYDEAATGALLVANTLFWALGYWQVEDHLVRFAPADLVIAPSARVRVPSGRERPMRQRDLEAVLARAARGRDGRYRAIASRALPGKILGGFQYHGTRPDDPNDIVPHEHRRELRALRVFGAWTNLVDMKAGNTLDTVVRGSHGRDVVRHYLQDVGSTFGIGATGPREFDEGWEPLFDGRAALERLVTLGLALKPWQTVRYVEYPSVGRFEGDRFDPRTWRPRVPPAAFYAAGPDDLFWAARRVAAFSDVLIRTAVHRGAYSDPKAEAHLVDVLIKRRDAIARAFLPAVTPLVDVALDDARGLTFSNAAVEADIATAPSGGYRVRWFAFDNHTDESRPLGDELQVRAPSAPLPTSVPRTEGTYVKASVWAVDTTHATWTTPVDVYFVRAAEGWRLVGLERRPRPQRASRPALATW